MFPTENGFLLAPSEHPTTRGRQESNAIFKIERTVNCHIDAGHNPPAIGEPARGFCRVDARLYHV